MVLYAIWQEVFWAHAFWQGLGAMQKYFILDAIMPAFVSRKCLSVQLLTTFPPRRRRNNPANIRMQEKRRLARHHQHKASLMEEELLLDNAVSPNCRVCRHFLRPFARFAAACSLGFSSPPNLHRSLPWRAHQVLHPPTAGKTGRPRIITTRRRLQLRAKTRHRSAPVSRMRGPTTAKGVPYRKGR